MQPIIRYKLQFSGKHQKDKTLVNSATYLDFLEQKSMVNGLIMANGY